MRCISQALWALLGALLAFLIQRAVAKDQPSKPLRLDPTFEATLRQLQQSYVEPLDNPSYWQALTRCAVQELDPYSYWLEPRQRIQQAQITRFGLSVARRPGHGPSGPVRVVYLVPGGAAQKAGLSLGDRIETINGMSVADLVKQSALDLALRPEGAKSNTLLLATPDRSFQLSAIGPQGQAREAFTHRAFQCSHKRCLLVSLRGFSSGVAQRLRSVVESISPYKLGGVVLDLQNNPGGDIDQAVAIADLFLADGVIARVRGRSGKRLKEIRASANQTLPKDIPVVVLVNAYTASAAELLSAALQDHRRALIVGDPSFGKGSIQRIHQFNDGSLLRFTTGRYYSPRDHAIDQRGIRPDLHWHAPGQAQGLSNASLCQLLQRAFDQR